MINPHIIDTARATLFLGSRDCEALEVKGYKGMMVAEQDHEEIQALAFFSVGGRTFKVGVRTKLPD